MRMECVLIPARKTRGPMLRDKLLPREKTIMKSNSIARSRRRSLMRPLTMALPAVLLTAWTHPSAGGEVPRFILRPPPSQTAGEYEYELPAQYNLNASCKVPNGIRIQPNSTKKFVAKVEFGGSELSGHTLSVWNSQLKPNPGCETIQVLLLPPGVEPRDGFPGNWAPLPAPPLAAGARGQEFGPLVPAQETTSLPLPNIECEYSFVQVTETVAGTQGGEVLYWVESTQDPRVCLNAPLQMRNTATGAAEGLKLVDPSWLPYDSSKPGRALMVHIDKIDDANLGATYEINAVLGRDPLAKPVPLRGGGNSFGLHVAPGIDTHEMVADVELSHTDSPAILADQPHLAVGRVNRLFLAPAVGHPWRVSLTSTSNHTRVPPSPSFGLGKIHVSPDSRVLPSATVDGRTAYFLQGTVVSDANFAFRAELDGAVEEFLTPAGRSLAALGTLDHLKQRTIKLGHVDKQLPKTTKVYWLPWDLRQAEISCGKGKHGIRSSSPTRALTEEEYRDCWLHVPDSDQLFRRTVVNGNANIDWDFEQLAIMATQNGTGKEIEIARLNGREFNHEVDPNDRRRSEFVAPIDGSILRKLGDVSSYTEIQFIVRHVQPADTTLRSELKNAYIPDELDAARTSELRVRTRLLPSLAYASLGDAEAKSMGWRFYVSGAANLSLYQSSDSGVGINKSSAYDGALKAKFGYGVVGTFERWNFSDNKPWLPIFSPQLNLGFFGPTDFDQPGGWKQFSGIAGVTLRLPAANTPKSDTIEAQTGLILWGRLTRGDRGEALGSLLFGVNVAIGAAP